MFYVVQMELKELEEKFRKSMVQNDQLHNEKSLIIYTVELYKDKFTDIEEELIHINVFENHFIVYLIEKIIKRFAIDHNL